MLPERNIRKNSPFTQPLNGATIDVDRLFRVGRMIMMRVQPILDLPTGNAKTRVGKFCNHIHREFGYDFGWDITIQPVV